MSAYHYFATIVLIFLLSLAGRSVSRTGSVAAGHMVSLAGRTKHSRCLLPKTKAKVGLKPQGYPRWNAGPPLAQPGDAQAENS